MAIRKNYKTGKCYFPSGFYKNIFYLFSVYCGFAAPEFVLSAS
jgi:hypothetical protein